MSSSSEPSSYTDQNYDMDLQKGFSIIGMVFGFLAFLVILRFGINMCIDIAVLRDRDSLMRTVSEFRRMICPCWHPRTEPQVVVQEMPTVIGMEQLIAGLDMEQKKSLMATILKGKIVTKEDIEKWRQQAIPDEEDNNNNNTLCSICLHDIEPGNFAISLNTCGHLFHQDCICEWLCSHAGLRDCPYCRAEIISQTMIEDAYRKKQQRL